MEEQSLASWPPGKIAAAAGAMANAIATRAPNAVTRAPFSGKVVMCGREADRMLPPLTPGSRDKISIACAEMLGSQTNSKGERQQ